MKREAEDEWGEMISARPITLLLRNPTAFGGPTSRPRPWRPYPWAALGALPPR